MSLFIIRGTRFVVAKIVPPTPNKVISQFPSQISDGRKAQPSVTVSENIFPFCSTLNVGLTIYPSISINTLAGTCPLLLKSITLLLFDKNLLSHLKSHLISSSCADIS